MIFTKQERNIILFVVFALFFGLVWLLVRKFVLQQSPDYSVLRRTEKAVNEDELKKHITLKEEKQSVIEKVNINKASVEDLASLPYLGTAKAQAIISWREENGKFKQVEDLILVKGIGKTLLEKFIKHIEI